MSRPYSLNVSLSMIRVGPRTELQRQAQTLVSERRVRPLAATARGVEIYA
jgi:hypothetical protein